MKILTWNIQATKGCDNRFDLPRIVNHIKQLGDMDVICLQEVSKHIPDLNDDDQPTLISNQFPDYESVWGPGFSAPDSKLRRCEFGNLTLVKSGLLRNSRVHSLPSPVVDTLQIPRTMVEVLVSSGSRSVTIFNTHLAFHSNKEIVAQVQALTYLREKCIAKSRRVKPQDAEGPYRYNNACDAVILCGDLNLDSDAYIFRDHISSKNWVDCWEAQYRSVQMDALDRSPTCGCFDHVQWPQGPHVRDYFLATENIASNTVRVDVDVDTNASDHQPVLLEINL